MKNTTKRCLAVLGVILGFLSSTGIGVIVPNVAGRVQAQEQSQGWAHVNCDKEHTGALQRAIDRARSGDTILVSGTCYENVSIPGDKDLLTLDGGGNATINGPDATVNTILIRGPRGITIRGLTIT